MSKITDLYTVGSSLRFGSAEYIVDDVINHDTRTKNGVSSLLLLPIIQFGSKGVYLPPEDAQNEGEKYAIKFCGVNSQPLEPISDAGLRHGVISAYGRHIPLMTPSTPEVRIGTPDTPLLVAHDAEWYTPSGAEKRSILSVQYAFRGHDGLVRVWVAFIPDKGRFDIQTYHRWFLEAASPHVGFSFRDKEDFCVTLVGHYGIVDLTIYDNAKKILRNSDTLRRTQISLERNIKLKISDKNRNYTRAVIYGLRDTMLLAPAGYGSLAALGKALKFPKLEIPDTRKGAMHTLLDEEPDTFIAYAARDSEVTLMQAETISGGPNKPVPHTLGSLAAKQFKETVCNINDWNGTEFDRNFRGMERKKVVTETSSGKLRTTYILETLPQAETILGFGSKAYFGGRNECFLDGIHHGPWGDFDLKGAYPAAMGLVDDPDYSATPMAVTHLYKGSFHPTSYLFAHVHFKFPDNTKYPCLPVKDSEGRGLIFPLEGETWASAPELHLAFALGAELKMTQSFGVMLGTTGKFSMRRAMTKMVEARAEAATIFGKKSMQELTAKEKANSVYGKLAQGLAGKRSYSTRTDGMTDAPPSSITAAPQAALTTSIVRACVSAALAQLGDLGYRVASVTTDGFLTDAPMEVVDSLDLYGFADLLRNSRRLMSGEPEIWEQKHASESLVMFKTRGGVGVGEVEGYALPHAGAGVKLSREEMEAADVSGIGKAGALGKKYLSRGGLVEFNYNSLPSPKEYIRNEADAIGETVHKTMDWEFDFKRCPVLESAQNRWVVVDGKRYPHVGYETRPWRTMREFDDARSVAKSTRGVAVKTVKQVGKTVARIESRQVLREKDLRVRGNDLDRTLAISLLRALRAGQCKWMDKSPETGRQHCELIGGAFGVELGPDDWKNAGRASRKQAVVNFQDPRVEMLGIVPVVKVELAGVLTG